MPDPYIEQIIKILLRTRLDKGEKRLAYNLNGITSLIKTNTKFKNTLTFINITSRLK